MPTDELAVLFTRVGHRRCGVPGPFLHLSEAVICGSYRVSLAHALPCVRVHWRALAQPAALTPGSSPPTAPQHEGKTQRGQEESEDGPDPSGGHFRTLPSDSTSV